MTKPGFDLILGSNTLKELGIVLDFQTKEITVDDISLPMRDINKLKTRATVDKAWTMNNSIYQDVKEPQSTLEVTKRLIKILDAKYEQADLRAIVRDNCTHLSVPEQTRLLELLQELEELFSGKLEKPWHWDDIHQQALDTVKATIARNVALAYPDYSQGFEIYTESSKYQLGAVITQSNKLLAFFSRKLSQAQQKYSVTEQELLAIVDTLKEFKGMLWGQKITVYTDHKNLMQDPIGLTSDLVYRWRLLLEEYGPAIVYIKGIHDTVADAISQLTMDPSQMTGQLG
eukprot:CCRYP_006636-RA/>CCRYP_006636-RA protein AED:0.47 eAED:0.67 QI:0/0/0/1/1/1/2/0/286